MSRTLVSVCALLGVLCCTSPAGAQTVVPWPASGAPLCTAPGDQFSLSPYLTGAVSWFSSQAPDSLYLGHAGDEPPTGGCPLSAGAYAGVVPDSFRATLFDTGICLGCPGCGCAVDLAQAWVSRDAVSDRILMRVRRGGLVHWPQSDIVIRTAGLGELSSPSLAAMGPNLPDSSAIVVWTEGSGPSSQVRAQRVGPDGTPRWNGPDGIALSTAGAKPTVLSMQGSQSVLVVWEDHTGASSDIRALSLQSDGTPTPGWPAGGLALEGRSEAGTNPHLVGGPFDLLVVWEESGDRFGGGKSIVARKLLASGLPDPAWPDSGIVVTSSPTVDHLEDVTGGSSIVWSDVRYAGPGNPNDLFAQGLNSDGTRRAGWPADGVALSTAPGSQDHARTAGGLYAWEDTRSGEAKVYVTQLDASGQRPCCWLADGNPAAIAAGVQRRPVIEGQMVYWEDGRDLATNGLDIYVQAFMGDGANGTVVGVYPGPLPTSVAWRAPFPNPAHTTTHLHLLLPRTTHVRVSVHDLLGRSVRTLSDGVLEAGPHDWDWRGTDDAGSRVPVGIYRVRATVNGMATTCSVVWIH